MFPGLKENEMHTPNEEWRRETCVSRTSWKMLALFGFSGNETPLFKFSPYDATYKAGGKALGG